MKKLPFGIQVFRELIEEDYVYVDKTQYIYNLLNETKYCFLSRPRRFGKSLLLDTIAEIFSGGRELFFGLSIYASGYAFEKHPVLRFDMSSIPGDTPEVFKKELALDLKEYAKSEGLIIERGEPSSIFKNLIAALHQKYSQKVVVLIDEYDKPILDKIENAENAEAIREILKNFYGVLKSAGGHLRFVFITGVTKFTKASVFSGMNNLRDITMSRKYANICGVPIEELEIYFGEHLTRLEALEKSRDGKSISERILDWYDGYSWDGESRVINPFSLLGFFSEENFKRFWYASGTPAFLVKLIKNSPSSFLTLKNLEMSENSLDAFDIRQMDIVPLLFQTGYLTVEKICRRDGCESYILKIPNFEVRDAFYLNILADFTDSGVYDAENFYKRIKESFKTGDLGIMLENLRGLFAKIPYQLHINSEAYYHSIFYAIMVLLGFEIDAEVSVSGGRIDATLEMGEMAYVMEFKYESCPPDASPKQKRELFAKTLDAGMEQIKNRGYADKYIGSGKTVYKAALAFLGRDNIEMKAECLQPGNGI